MLKQACSVYPSMTLLKEILINEQLQQASLVRMLGYCVRSGTIASKHLKYSGIMAVYEFWDTLDVELLTLQPWTNRIKYAIDLGMLLNNFETSPLGSPGIVEFVLVNNSITFSDVGDVSNIEPSCINYFAHGQRTSNGSIYPTPQCEFDLQCVADVYMGHNAKKNLYEMNNSFFKRLLESSSFPLEIRTRLDELQTELENLIINAMEFVEKLQR